MIITLNDLFQKSACTEGLLLYQKFFNSNFNWSFNSITTNDNTILSHIKFLIHNFNIPVINLNFKDSNYIRFFSYDNNNNLLSSENSNGLSIYFSYDNNNNLLSSKNSDGFSISYSYDNNNNLLSSKNSKNYSKSFSYDDNDNLISTIDSDDVSLSYSYDKNNNLILLSTNKFSYPNLNIKKINNNLYIFLL